MASLQDRMHSYRQRRKGSGVCLDHDVAELVEK